MNTETTDRQQLIQQAREAIDFVAAHPDTKLPFPLTGISPWTIPVDSQDEFFALVNKLAPCGIDVTADGMTVSRFFGRIEISAKCPIPDIDALAGVEVKPDAVRIVNCSWDGECWYRHRIGETFTVLEERGSPDRYCVAVLDHPDYERAVILKIDVVAVPPKISLDFRAEGRKAKRIRVTRPSEYGALADYIYTVTEILPDGRYKLGELTIGAIKPEHAEVIEYEDINEEGF